MLSFEIGHTEVVKAARNKLFARNENQIDNHTLMFDMLHLYRSDIYTYRCRGVTIVLC